MEKPKVDKTDLVNALANVAAVAVGLYLEKEKQAEPITAAGIKYAQICSRFCLRKLRK